MNFRFHRRSLAVLLGALLSGTALGGSTTETVPRTDAWWQTRHASFNTNVAALGAQAQVIFIGDSITQGWEGEGKEVWAKCLTTEGTIPRDLMPVYLHLTPKAYGIWADSIEPKLAVVLGDSPVVAKPAGL